MLFFACTSIHLLFFFLRRLLLLLLLLTRLSLFLLLLAPPVLLLLILDFLRRLLLHPRMPMIKTVKRLLQRKPLPRLGIAIKETGLLPPVSKQRRALSIRRLRKRGMKQQKIEAQRQQDVRILPLRQILLHQEVER